MSRTSVAFWYEGITARVCLNKGKYKLEVLGEKRVGSTGIRYKVQQVQITLLLHSKSGCEEITNTKIIFSNL